MSAIIYDNQVYKSEQSGTVVLAKDRLYESGTFGAIALSGDDEGKYLEGWFSGDFTPITDTDEGSHYVEWARENNFSEYSTRDPKLGNK